MHGKWVERVPMLRRAGWVRRIMLAAGRAARCGELVWGANHIQLGVILNPL